MTKVHDIAAGKYTYLEDDTGARGRFLKNGRPFVVADDLTKTLARELIKLRGRHEKLSADNNNLRALLNTVVEAYRTHETGGEYPMDFNEWFIKVQEALNVKA